MKALKTPYLHVAVISLFTLFYSGILLITSGHIEFQRTLYYANRGDDWTAGGANEKRWIDWANFLYKGYQQYIALIFLVLTAVIVVLLLTQYKRFDEYQIYTFQKCFMIAGLVTMVAMAKFFGDIMSIPNGALEKMTLLVIEHWTAILLADLFYVLWSLKGSYRAIWKEDIQPMLRSVGSFWREMRDEDVRGKKG